MSIETHALAFWKGWMAENLRGSALTYFVSLVPKQGANRRRRI
jgi:hypothetical protein